MSDENATYTEYKLPALLARLEGVEKKVEGLEKLTSVLAKQILTVAAYSPLLIEPLSPEEEVKVAEELSRITPMLSKETMPPEREEAYQKQIAQQQATYEELNTRLNTLVLENAELLQSAKPPPALAWEELRQENAKLATQAQSHKQALDELQRRYNELKLKFESEAEQHQIDNTGNQDWIDSLCKQLCAMEDALGFKNDSYDKRGKWVPTIGPWLDRVRDLVAAEGVMGDVKDILDRIDIGAHQGWITAQALALCQEARDLIADAGKRRIAELRQGCGQFAADTVRYFIQTKQQGHDLVKRGNEVIKLCEVQTIPS